MKNNVYMMVPFDGMSNVEGKRFVAVLVQRDLVDAKSDFDDQHFKLFMRSVDALPAVRDALLMEYVKRGLYPDILGPDCCNVSLFLNIQGMPEFDLEPFRKQLVEQRLADTVRLVGGCLGFGFGMSVTNLKNLTEPLSYQAVETTFRTWRKSLGERARPYSLHGLRKLSIIQLAEAGASDAEIQAATGQSAKMVAYYRARASRKALSKAAQMRRG